MRCNSSWMISDGGVPIPSLANSFSYVLSPCHLRELVDSAEYQFRSHVIDVLINDVRGQAIAEVAPMVSACDPESLDRRFDHR